MISILIWDFIWKNDSSAGIVSELLLKIGNGQYPERAGKVVIPETLGKVVS